MRVGRKSQEGKTRGQREAQVVVRNTRGKQLIMSLLEEFVDRKCIECSRLLLLPLIHLLFSSFFLLNSPLSHHTK